MRSVFVFGFILAIINFNAVHSASYYVRAGRDAEDPVASEIFAEVLSELRREPERMVSEEIVPVVKNLDGIVEPIVAMVEPIQVALVAEPLPSIAEIPAAVKSVDTEKSDSEFKLKLNNDSPIKKESEAAIKAAAEIEKEPFKESMEGKQSEGAAQPAPERPTLLQQAQQTITGIITNNPIANAINNIRQPNTPAANVEQNAGASENLVATDPTTSRPNIIQQFQSGVQSIQNQISSVFTPSSSATSAASSASQTAAEVSPSSPSRPGFLQQIQNAIGQIVTRPSENAAAAPAAPATNPIQGLVSGIQSNIQNAQNQITGIFRPAASSNTATAPQTAVQPAPETPDTPVNAVENAQADVIKGEEPSVPVVNEHIETVDNKVDQAN